MGTRNLGREEDLARQLAAVLDADANKRMQAIVANQLRDTPETTSVTPLPTPGLLASAMSPAEQDLLRTLITEYANNLAPELAAERLSRIEGAGLDSVGFLWSGSLVPGQAHYYRVQGPTFLIEYVNEQNNANHVHSAWRDFEGDYGRDVIANTPSSTHIEQRMFGVNMAGCPRCRLDPRGCRSAWGKKRTSATQSNRSIARSNVAMLSGPSTS